MTTENKVFIAKVTTFSGDHYTYSFTSKPTVEDVVREVYESEGEIEDFDWYLATTKVSIIQSKINHG